MRAPEFANDPTAASDNEKRGRDIFPTESRPRGRDISPKSLPYLHEHGSPPRGLPGLPVISNGRRLSALSAQLAQPAYQAHHQPPPLTAPIEVSADPILYLPPLLSALPHGVEHDHATRERRLELPEFETRLPDIDPASLALHRALHFFRPLDDSYAAQSYNRAFNWDDLRLPRDVDREWYCVVFRSRRRPESSTLSLYAADREAHAEAVRNGGLVMYWYGVPDETGLNLATCIWQSRKHAIKAISGPKHIDAMKQAQGAYETYNLERWILRKDRGQSELKLIPWEGGDVGW